jgi:hypothetical protein
MEKKKREKKFIDDKPMIVELLTRGKEVIVKWLLGLLVHGWWLLWWFDMAIWVGVKERGCCNGDKRASSLFKDSDKVRERSRIGVFVSIEMRKNSNLESKK